MNWDKGYDELTLLDKEGAGLPNRSYQLDHFQRCFFEKICDGIATQVSDSKSDEFDTVVNKLYDLQNGLEELINELTKE